MNWNTFELIYEKYLSIKKYKNVYSVEIKDINDEFSFKTEVSKLEKIVLLEFPNPNYCEI